MVQELIELRSSIEEGRYQDALNIIDELEEMSKASILRNIDSYLVRIFIHLIKNQIENRLTKSWAVSIIDSVRQIRKLNLKGNQKSYYIKQNEWQPYLEEALAAAILPASLEVLEGQLKSDQIKQRLDRNALLKLAENLLVLTYSYSPLDLPDALNTELTNLPGGEEYLQ